VVLVVLVLVWAVVLGPSLLRRTMDRQSKDSIGSFHRQLNVLGRTGPSLMPPAHRLAASNPRPAPSLRARDDAFGKASLVSVRNRPAPLSFYPEAIESDTRATLRRPDPYFRPGACKRRRDVLMVLLCTLTLTGLVAIIPAMHVLLAVTGLVGVVLVAYLGLLIRMRSHALEREIKLRYLPPSTEYDVPISVRRVASR
jgi:hypothetical protein